MVATLSRSNHASNREVLIMLKLFYICDDDHETSFVSQFKRRDIEIIDELKRLEVGDIYPLSNTRYIIRGE